MRTKSVLIRTLITKFLIKLAKQLRSYRNSPQAHSQVRTNSRTMQSDQHQIGVTTTASKRNIENLNHSIPHNPLIDTPNADDSRMPILESSPMIKSQELRARTQMEKQGRRKVTKVGSLKTRTHDRSGRVSTTNASSHSHLNRRRGTSSSYVTNYKNDSSLNRTAKSKERARKGLANYYIHEETEELVSNQPQTLEKRRI